jgi:pyrroline-5-carboxylate reductase
MKVKIACVGAGNMGTALMKGAAAGGAAVGFFDTDRAKARTAAKALGGAAFAGSAEAVKDADFVFLAVKPQTLKEALDQMRPALQERAVSGKPAVLVSMAAGWSIAKIQAALGGTGVPAVRGSMAGAAPVARIMPNTPALVSRGMIALAASSTVSTAALSELEKILGGAGIVDRIDEKLMDAVTALSGSGPAFVCQFLEALADGGVLAGLPRDKALRYAAQTLLGTAAMALETGKHPGELKDMAASPGGTTIVGIAALERGGLRGAVISAVEAAWKRSLELA